MDIGHFVYSSVDEIHWGFFFKSLRLKQKIFRLNYSKVKDPETWRVTNKDVFNSPLLYLFA